jgi:Mor family transcriptional regulator
MAIAMKGDRLMLEYIKNRVTDFDVGYFVNELANASKNLGILEAKIDSYQFNSILIPMLQKKEAISSMYIEGTQTTITDVLKSEVNPQQRNRRIVEEFRNGISMEELAEKYFLSVYAIRKIIYQK